MKSLLYPGVATPFFRIMPYSRSIQRRVAQTQPATPVIRA
jgi:hypothetical protein